MIKAINNSLIMPVELALSSLPDCPPPSAPQAPFSKTYRSAIVEKQVLLISRKGKGQRSISKFRMEGILNKLTGRIIED